MIEKNTTILVFKQPEDERGFILAQKGVWRMFSQEEIISKSQPDKNGTIIMKKKSLAIVVADQVSTSLCLWGKLPMAHVLSAMVMDFLL